MVGADQQGLPPDVSEPTHWQGLWERVEVSQHSSRRSIGIVQRGRQSGSISTAPQARQRPSLVHRGTQ